MFLSSLLNSLHRRTPKPNGFAFGRFSFAVFLLLVPTKFSTAETSKPFRTARLTYLTGDVRVQQSGNAASSTAVVNLPLVEGAVLSTGDDGEAEVEFEDGSLLRLTPHSGAGLVNLSADSSGEYQSRIAILGGLIYVELRSGSKFRYIVDAGGDEITPIENSTIRINFDEPPAVISILEGSAHLNAASGSDVSATAGQTVRAGDPADGGIYMLTEVVAPESWDQWNLDRDATAANEASTETDVRSKYAGDQGYGWADLDANGNWYDVPGEGEVWQPDSAAQADQGGSGDAAAQSAFDPYGNGNWAYTPAGYVWASGYGWGWLPYRCGSWNYWDGFGWGWTPGINCGVYGFGGYAGGGVYIGHAPGFYKKPGRPIPKPDPIHPILRGRGGPVPVVPVNPTDRNVRSGTSERVIAGNLVTPLPRVGGTLADQSFLGSSHSVVAGGRPRREYALERSSSAPANSISGSAMAPTSNARPAWRSMQPAEGVRQPAIVQRPGYTVPQNNGNRSTSPSRPAPATQPRAPAPASRPVPAPASRPSAAPSPHGR